MTARVSLARPWLKVDLDQPVRVLSWALNRPGFVTTRQIVWREVRNAELTPDLDVSAWLATELAATNATDAVAFLTSRDVTAFRDAQATCDGVTVRCIATVGLSNAERVGARVDRRGKDWGTINLLVLTDTGLSDTARIEALSIAAQARTVAVMEAGLPLPTGIATGTGTDCIAVAAPDGGEGYAGLHTPLGEALGRAVLDAIGGGVAEWMATVRRREEI